MREHKTDDGGTLICDELAEVVADQHGNTWIWSPAIGGFERHDRHAGVYNPPSEQSSQDGEGAKR
jgi:hypothetical protein